MREENDNMRLCGTDPFTSGYPYLYTLNFSGNSLYLFPPFQEKSSFPSAVVQVGSCQSVNIFGNTLAWGSCGVQIGEDAMNVVIMDNDFGNVSYGGICLAWGMVASPSLQNAQIFRNIIGHGVNFHSQVSYPYSFSWFFNQNQYLNGSANVPAFRDPAASSAHVSN
jgi:hypothetical protein